MNQEGPLQKKAYAFAVDVVFFCKEIIEIKKEYVMTKQLIKSGTSIGANIEEAQHAQSKSDFISKLSIALKEAYESRFWICLLRDTHYAETQKANLLLTPVNEIIAMLTASINTAKRNQSN